MPIALSADGTVVGSSPGHDRAGRFVIGNGEYAARRRRIADKARCLSREYLATTATQKLFLELAAQHLDTAQTARSARRRRGATDAALRILAELPKRLPRKRRQSVARRSDLSGLPT